MGWSQLQLVPGVPLGLLWCLEVHPKLPLCLRYLEDRDSEQANSHPTGGCSRVTAVWKLLCMRINPAELCLIRWWRQSCPLAGITWSITGLILSHNLPQSGNGEKTKTGIDRWKKEEHYNQSNLIFDTFCGQHFSPMAIRHLCILWFIPYTAPSKPLLLDFQIINLIIISQQWSDLKLLTGDVI